jgi:hypothetical protein
MALSEEDAQRILLGNDGISTATGSALQNNTAKAKSGPPIKMDEIYRRFEANNPPPPPPQEKRLSWHLVKAVLAGKTPDQVIATHESRREASGLEVREPLDFDTSWTDPLLKEEVAAFAHFAHDHDDTSNADALNHVIAKLEGFA